MRRGGGEGVDLGWARDATNDRVYKNNFKNTMYKKKTTTIIIIIIIIIINIIITILFQAHCRYFKGGLCLMPFLCRPIKKRVKTDLFFNRIFQNIQIKTNPEIFARQKKNEKGQNNLQFDGIYHHHHHHALTFLHLLLIRIFKR